MISSKQSNADFARVHHRVWQWKPGGLRHNAKEWCFRMAQDLHFEAGLPMRSWVYQRLIKWYR